MFLYQTVLIQHSTVHLPYLEQALLLDQRPFLQRPEVEVGFAAGHYDVAVCRVEVGGKHRLVGTLKQNKELRSCASIAVKLGLV